MSDQDSKTDGSPPQFEIQKLYLKDVSFETPNSPEVFTGEWKPEVNVELSTESKNLHENIHEVVLTITVTARVDEKIAYLVEAKQAGIFNLKGFPEELLGHLLGSYCPNVLFSFAREAIADLIVKGGFPHFFLNPINFDLLYAEYQKSKAPKEAPTARTH